MHSNRLPSHWLLDDKIPDSMPVLDRWLDKAAQNSPLSGTTALMIQHQLGNQVPQTKALIKLGISPKDIYWIDIPYTSSQTVRNALISLGIPSKNLLVNDFQLLDKYAPYQRLRVQSFLTKLSENPPEHLLVLDDGSYVLEALSCLRKRLPKISIVEQTTRGLIKIEDNTAIEFCSKEYPIINVARSTPKQILEPPFIGFSVCQALQRNLGEKLSIGHSDHCLILGYGAIGKQVALFMHTSLKFRKNNVHVFDTDKDRMLEAKEDHFSNWTRSDRDVRFIVVVGCSGRSSFKIGDYVLLEDGAYLASATSGTVELSREDFIELAEDSPYDDIWIVRDGLDQSLIHSDLRFHFVDRDATFVNGGFPVNFDGRVNCVPAFYIQPTPTIMCAAAVQAVNSTGSGLLDLDPTFCRWIDAEFRKELSDEISLLGGIKNGL